MGIRTDKTVIFQDNKTTLREASKDDSSDLYMTESFLEVVNFDKVKEEYIRGMKLAYTPCSSDALYYGEDDKVYFIEFKNGLMDNRTVYNVQEKIYTSLLIYTDIIDERISSCKENLNFILVYNEKKNMDKVKKEQTKYEGDTCKRQIGKYFSEKARKNFIAFGLEKFKDIYFKDIYTYTQKEFEERFVNVYEKSKFI